MVTTEEGHERSKSNAKEKDKVVSEFLVKLHISNLHEPLQGVFVF